MRFAETPLSGVYLIDPEPVGDQRGYLARTFCTAEFAVQGLETKLVQCTLSFSPRKGTLRGMHYQAPPFEEGKLVRCTRGSVFDVVLDLRRSSPTFLHWVSAVLSADNHRLVFVAKGCAHGFQTLEDDTEVFYQMTECYHPESSRGVRWDDPAFAIDWPKDDRLISPGDLYPDFEP